MLSIQLPKFFIDNMKYALSCCQIDVYFAAWLLDNPVGDTVYYKASVLCTLWFDFLLHSMPEREREHWMCDISLKQEQEHHAERLTLFGDILSCSCALNITQLLDIPALVEHCNIDFLCTKRRVHNWKSLLADAKLDFLSLAHCDLISSISIAHRSHSDFNSYYCVLSIKHAVK